MAFSAWLLAKDGLGAKGDVRPDGWLLPGLERLGDGDEVGGAAGRDLGIGLDGERLDLLDKGVELVDVDLRGEGGLRARVGDTGFTDSFELFQ